jgi:hypothetical protein
VRTERGEKKREKKKKKKRRRKHKNEKKPIGGAGRSHNHYVATSQAPHP